MCIGCFSKKIQDPILDHNALKKECEESVKSTTDLKTKSVFFAVIQLCEETERNKEKLTPWDFGIWIRGTARKEVSNELEESGLSKSSEEYNGKCAKGYEDKIFAIEEAERVAEKHIKGLSLNLNRFTKRCRQESENSEDEGVVILAGEVLTLCEKGQDRDRPLKLTDVTRWVGEAIEKTGSLEEKQSRTRAGRKIVHIASECIKG